VKVPEWLRAVTEIWQLGSHFRALNFMKMDGNIC